MKPTKGDVAGHSASANARLLELEQKRQALLHDWDTAEHDIEEEECERYDALLAALNAAIADWSAAGLADLQIKARIMRAAIDENCLSCTDEEIAIVDSLVADIDRLAGRAP